MKEMAEYIGSGLLLGLMAGISPGPIFALVVTETLKQGQKEGIKLACVPFITDIPIVLISLVMLSRIQQFETGLGILTLLGSVFLLYLAYENITYRPEKEISSKRINSFSKGIIANFLSPHPYLFWLLVGGPIVFRAYKINLQTAVLFVLTFYLMLVGSKIIIALVTYRLKNILRSKTFIYLIRFLGLALILFSILLIVDAVNYIF
jgi:threonine/homoserine/homoserine lactone efflux protein